MSSRRSRRAAANSSTGRQADTCRPFVAAERCEFACCASAGTGIRSHTEYEATRADYDGAAVPPVPNDFVELAAKIAREAGFSFLPGICLINWYGPDGRMGLHQDKDESPQSLSAGLPVVSISLGDTARFLFGGSRRRDPVQTILLESGDAFVFGGPARLRYHGVSRIVPGTAPPGFGMAGRFNLTFRQYLDAQSTHLTFAGISACDD